MDLKHKLLLPLLAILLATAAFYGYSVYLKTVPSLSPNPLATTTEGGIEAGGTGKYTIERVDIPPNIEYPSLTRPIAFPADFSAEAREIMTTKMKTLISALQKDQRSLENWLKLASDRKLIEDYEGARQIWEFVATVAPEDPIAFGNLGELYALYIKDFPKSEYNWKRSIELKPDYVYGYRALYELYTLSYAAKAAEAPKILEQGIGKNPKATDLMVLLARYWVGKGDKTKARLYYDKAIAVARADGNQQLINSLQTERDSIQ